MDPYLKRDIIQLIREHRGCSLQEAHKILNSPPGYVRRLRDSAAVEIMGRQGMVASRAMVEADELIEALGYEQTGTNLD